MMYSEPPSPQQGHSSTTTPTKVTLRTPRSFTPDLSSKRHLSMGTLPSWGGDNNEDNPMNTSSASIAVSHLTYCLDISLSLSLSLSYSLSLSLSLSYSLSLSVSSILPLFLPFLSNPLPFSTTFTLPFLLFSFLRHFSVSWLYSTGRC